VRLPQPDGEELVFDTLRGRPLVINFWATWCPPCVKEMPLLEQFARSHPDVVVVGVAVDKAEAVRSFLARAPVTFRIGVAGFAGSALARHLGNAQGALPFSVAVDRAGQIVARRLGEIDANELADWAKRLSA
jgi:thiol-disulfide isomerase/thioredoxin